MENTIFSEVANKNDLAEGTFLTKWPSWLRWMLFLPASFIAPLLFLLIQSITTTWFLDIGPNAFYLVVTRGVVYGAGSVYVGSLVAPFYQKGVSVFMLILLALFCGMAILANIMIEFNWSSVIEMVIMLIAGGFATYGISQEK